MTTLSEKKLLTTEKLTISDEVHKLTENITTGEDVVKGTDEVYKHTENITTNQDVEKVNEKLEDMKEVVVTIRGKYSDKFEGQYKGYTGWFNPDHDFLKRNISTLEPDFYKTL